MVFAGSALAWEQLMSRVHASGAQTVLVGSNTKIAVQCRTPGDGGSALIRYRMSTVDGGTNAGDPVIAFVAVDGTQLDPYVISSRGSQDRIILQEARDSGVLDCSVLRVVP